MESLTSIPFKDAQSVSRRREMALKQREQNPGFIPVIVERMRTEKHLPHLKNSRFLLPADMLIIQLLGIIRKEINIKAHQSIYLLLSRGTMVSVIQSIEEVYFKYKAEDGFLYVTYASQEMFGCLSANVVTNNSLLRNIGTSSLSVP